MEKVLKTGRIEDGEGGRGGGGRVQKIYIDIYKNCFFMF